MANVSELFRTVNVTDDWRHNNHERGMVNEHRRSVARGEGLFNNTRINIAGVSGLNDELKVDSIPGFCGTCHDSPNVGNHSVKAPLDIGVPDAGDKKPPALDISGLPVFTLKCSNLADGHPLKDKVYKVTDPGRAMITGKCKDIGRLRSCGGWQHAHPISAMVRRQRWGTSSTSTTSGSESGLPARKKPISSIS